MPAAAQPTRHQDDSVFSTPGAWTSQAQEHWYALWTHSHCERLVHDQLVAKGFRPFLPTLDVWSKRGGVRHVITVPMFPGYLFLRHVMDKTTQVEIRKVRQLVRVLGDSWDRLSPVADSEIQAVETVVASGVRVMPCSFLREGQRVRVTKGPLAGIEGVHVKTDTAKGLLVLSVDLVRQSIAVIVDGTDVVPA